LQPSLIASQVLLLPMLKPRSYTREDVVELHCHGGTVCVQRVLALCLVRSLPSAVNSCSPSIQRAGARMAQPGEFTLRAFLNGMRLFSALFLPRI